MEYIHISAFYEYHVLNINSNVFIGGAYSLEDGLAPSGGEGWAPPRVRALMMMFIFICLTLVFC